MSDQIRELEERSQQEYHNALRMHALEKEVMSLNNAFHDLLQHVIAKGDGNALLTHPNRTIRETAKSYMRKD